MTTTFTWYISRNGFTIILNFWEFECRDWQLIFAVKQMLCVTHRAFRVIDSSETEPIEFYYLERGNSSWFFSWELIFRRKRKYGGNESMTSDDSFIILKTVIQILWPMSTTRDRISWWGNQYYICYIRLINYN